MFHSARLCQRIAPLWSSWTTQWISKTAQLLSASQWSFSVKKKIQVALLYSTTVACYLSDKVSYIAKTFQLHIIGYPTRLSDISHHSLIFTTFVIWECDIHQNIATCGQGYHAKMRYIAAKPDISHHPTTGQNCI